MIIDSHHHLINLSRIDYSFLKPESEIYRSFEPEDLEPLLSKFGVDQTIVVQAQNNSEETDYLLEAAEQTGWIAGVIGWVPLDKPALAKESLERLMKKPKFKGVRHLLFEEKESWLSSSEVQKGLKLLEENQLIFEIPAEYPDHLYQIPAIAQEVPDLKIVVDHLGKPPIKDRKIDNWFKQMEKVAACPNVYTKISGLNTAADPENWEANDLKPYIDAAFELFGYERLMYGSDWPVANLAGNYEKVWNASNQGLADRPPEEREAVFGLNAATVYNLNF